MTPAGLEPAIPGSVGRCLIHWATGPDGICHGAVVNAQIDGSGGLWRRRASWHRPYRLVVRTSRRGRDNPGSTPGMVMISALRPAAQICLLIRSFWCAWIYASSGGLLGMLAGSLARAGGLVCRDNRVREKPSCPPGQILDIVFVIWAAALPPCQPA